MIMGLDRWVNFFEKQIRSLARNIIFKCMHIHRGWRHPRDAYGLGNCGPYDPSLPPIKIQESSYGYSIDYRGDSNPETRYSPLRPRIYFDSWGTRWLKPTPLERTAGKIRIAFSRF